MKTVLALFMMVSLMGCASRTEFGKCVGVMQDKDPTLIYDYSTRNIVVGTIFSGMVFPPVLVLLKELECPVGRK